MVNVLIAIDSIEFSVSIMNYIHSKNKNIRVVFIVKDTEELLKILNEKNDINLLIIDSKILFEKEILEKTSLKKQFSKNIIVLLNNASDINKIKNKEIFYAIIYKNTSIEKIYFNINNFSLKKEFNLCNKSFRQENNR